MVAEVDRQSRFVAGYFQMNHFPCIPCSPWFKIMLTRTSSYRLTEHNSHNHPVVFKTEQARSTIKTGQTVKHMEAMVFPTAALILFLPARDQSGSHRFTIVSACWSLCPSGYTYGVPNDYIRRSLLNRVPL